MSWCETPDGAFLGWTIGIHDRSVAATVIVAAYLIAIAACLRAWRRESAAAARAPHGQRRRYAPWFWLFVAGLLLLLAINKPLDLHDLLTDYGRRLARRHGWYENRRRVQLAFATAVGAAALVVLVTIAWRLRAAAGRYALALIGLWLIAVFAGLRVTSFHHVDQWFSTRLRGAKLHWMIELLAIVVIAAGAAVPRKSEVDARAGDAAPGA